MPDNGDDQTATPTSPLFYGCCAGLLLTIILGLAVWLVLAGLGWL